MSHMMRQSKKVKAELLRLFNDCMQHNNYEALLDYCYDNKASKVQNYQFSYSKSQPAGSILHALCSIPMILDEDSAVNFDYEEYIDAVDSFINMYEEEELDVDIEDSEGNSPLYSALKAGCKRLAKLLISVYEADVFQENKLGFCPFDYITDRTKFDDELERLAINALGHKINEVEIDIDSTLSEHKKRIKSRMQAHGPLSEVPKNQRVKPHNLIESVIFFENPENKAFFQGKLESLYQNLVMKPLMDILALFVRSEEGFKIFIVDGPDVSNVKPTEKNTEGYYINGKNSVFVAGKINKGVDYIVSCIVHESCHYVANKLYQNHANPFFDGDEDGIKVWAEAAQEVFNMLNSGNKWEDLDNDEYVCMKLLEDVFTAYNQKEWLTELVVRVPQIISLIGPEKGLHWLRENTPLLLNAYEEHFNMEAVNFSLQNTQVQEEPEPDNQTNANTAISIVKASAIFSAPLNQSGGGDSPSIDSVERILEECYEVPPF